jgi:DNA-directed RNA polymerase specialized sigma24 family protein
VLEEQRQLIRRLAAGDRQAEHRFTSEWYDRIRYWVSDIAPPYKIEDYVHEVWLHLKRSNWLRLLQWQPLFDDEAWHDHSLEGFLKRIAQNKAIDLRRSEPPELPPGLDPNDIIDRTTVLGNDPVVEAERSRLIAAFEFCSSWFRDRDHLLLWLSWEGHTGEHIADRIGTNANNVYQRRSYIFRRLRECLIERLPEYFRRV